MGSMNAFMFFVTLVCLVLSGCFYLRFWREQNYFRIATGQKSTGDPQRFNEVQRLVQEAGGCAGLIQKRNASRATALLWLAVGLAFWLVYFGAFAHHFH